MRHCGLGQEVEEIFSIGIPFVDFHLKWLNWFLVLILEGDVLIILIECIVFLPPFLVVTRMSLCQQFLSSRS